MELTGKEFNHYTKKEWIDLIGRSVKNAGAENIRWEVFPGLEGNPIATEEDFTSTVDFGLPGHSGDWQIGLIIDQPQLSSLGKEEGAEAIWLDLGHDDWTRIAEDLAGHAVSWFLPWSFEGGKEDFLNAFGLLNDDVHDKSIGWIADDFKGFSFADVRHRFSMGSNGFRLIIRLLSVSEDELHKTHALVRFIKDFTDWIEHENLKPDEIEWLTQHIGLMIPIRSHMLFEIAFLRVIQYIWYNVLKAYKIPYNKLMVIALVDHTQNNFNPNDQLILNSISTAVAAAGGADTIFIKTDPLTENRFESQVLNKNIQLICKHEAGLNKVTDAIAGSYALEDLTARLVQYIWKKMQESA